MLLLVNEFKEDNFINNVKKDRSDNFRIKKIGNMDNVINLIYMKVSNNISKKFINFINSVDLDFLSNLLKR